MVSAGESVITHSHLVADLRALGVGTSAGQVLMLHASVKAVGKVMGGPNVIIQAMLEALGSDGTLMMYVGWEDLPDFIPDLPAALQHVYYDEHPAFDPAIARAVRDYGIVAECLRTWPGSQRSQNPEASMVAVGAQAHALTDAHPRDYGYGPGSPLAKLIDLRGQVLMLGAPLDTITLLHYAENVARLRQKAVVRYPCPILKDGQKVWIDVEDYNTGEPHDDYTFEGIAGAYLAAGRARQGRVGNAPSYLFAAADLVSFAVGWLEERFG